MNNLRGIGYVFICILMWALIPVVAKMGQQELDNHQFLFWSSLVSFLVCLLFLLFSGKYVVLRDYGVGDWLIIAGLGFLGTYLYYILLYFGYAKAEGLEVLILQYSWPLFIVFLSSFLLNERWTFIKFFSVITGFLGVALIISKGDIVLGDDLSVYLLVILGAFSFALFSVLSKRFSYEPLGLVTCYFAVATLCSFVSMLLLSDFAPPKEIFAILLNGSLVNGVSYILWISALRLTKASYIAPLVFLTPVFSTFYLIIFFDEPVRWIYLLGLVLVIISGLVATLNLSDRLRK